VSSALTEQELWSQLEEQRLRARRIEELITEAKRKRLRDSGRPTLAEAVQRVSQNDSGAGYDVASFELSGEPRLIEVESSTGVATKFFWSANERFCATASSNYRIYFVPLAQRATKAPFTVVKFYNPVSLIASGALLDQAATWLVSEAENCDKCDIEHVKL